MPPVVIAGGPCGPVPGELSAVLPLPTVPLRTATEPLRVGSVRLRVRSAGPEHPPLADVTVTLYRDTTSNRPEDRVASGVTGVDGETRFDSVAPGMYGLGLRRIGFIPISNPIRVLAGAVTPVDAALAQERIC